MDTFLKYVGAIIVLLGVVGLLVYAYGVKENWLLVTSLVVEVVGILSFVIINKQLKN